MAMAMSKSLNVDCRRASFRLPPLPSSSFSVVVLPKKGPLLPRACLSSSSSSSSSSSIAGENADFSASLLRNSKVIHLVRHAQGHHNVAGDLDYAAYLSYEYLDASLTSTGWKQVDLLRRHLTETGIIRSVDLVVTSPLTRTMQTAAGAFGGRYLLEEGNPPPSPPPLMLKNVGDSTHAAISSSDCPPFIAIEWCREQMGMHPCDKRRPISTYRKQFPGIDFSQVEVDDDSLWLPDSREAYSEICSRGRTFIRWLLKRRERQIAVVSHSTFLRLLCSLFAHDCSIPIQEDLWKRFANCEMRTIVLTDQNALGAPIHEDYLGGIPLGADLSSGEADTLLEVS